MRQQTRILTLAASIAFAAFTSVNAKPLGATLTLSGGKPLACFVISIEGDTLKYGLDENGSGPQTIPLSTVEAISLRSPDTWSEALGQYNGGDYKAAESSFSGLAQDYAGIASVRDQYGALARFYHMQSLKHNGKYEKLAKTLDTLKASPIALGDHHQSELEILKGWGMLGTKDWDGVAAFVGNFEDAASQGDSPRVPFKAGLSRSKVSELLFLRGYAKLQKQDRAAGLEDLAGTVGLNFGANAALTKSALTEMLKQFANLEEDDLLGRREAYSLAVYLKGLSGGVIDPAFTKLLDAPPMPKPEQGGGEESAAPAAGAPAAPAEAAPAAEGEAAPAAPEAAPAPAAEEEKAA